MITPHSTVKISTLYSRQKILLLMREVLHTAGCYHDTAGKKFSSINAGF
jgi:hypothetical protein